MGAVQQPQAEPSSEDRADTTEPSEQYLVGPDSDVTPTISVVMPTLNEAGGIATCIEWIKEGLADAETYGEIVVSDSSDDRTPEIAREMGAIVVEPDAPGYGNAYKYAFERVRGQYVVMGDADTTYDFSQLPRLLEPVAEGDADICMGSRLNGEIEPGAMPLLHQYVGNPLLTAFLNAFYDTNVSDSHSGFRVFDRSVLDELALETTGMEFASEMVMEAGARDLTIEEVPITYHEREGDATLNSFRDGWRHVRFMLVNAPGYLFLYPGAALIALGAVVMALAGTGVAVGDVSFGTHSIIAGSLSTIVGLQIASFGVFARLAGNPVNEPRDAITTAIVDRLRLEHGVVAGLALLTVGGGYGAWLVGRWAASGFQRLPLVGADVVAFTAIVLGLQAVFSSFFFSTLADDA
ncbi:glycosyltransferase family 2 protein [Halococcoides cellulosivorans]|uniref:Glycosyl transferase n=1 Tax=Halococcoides cellulosivorans TaxID=1679096 RepID=A0A2R4X470_9EURY|nr:glycosyltransferase family 2 protein [Halococcoides cellulosivorans]AWB28580.1 glycosyl transferase [Halococcoides cellulosivorans]